MSKEGGSSSGSGAPSTDVNEIILELNMLEQLKSTLTNEEYVLYRKDREARQKFLGLPPLGSSSTSPQEMEKLRKENRMLKRFMYTTKDSKQLHDELFHEQLLQLDTSQFKFLQETVVEKEAIKMFSKKVVAKKGRGENIHQNAYKKFFDQYDSKLAVMDTHDVGLLSPVMKPDFTIIREVVDETVRLLWSMIVSIVEVKPSIANEGEVVGQIIERHYEILNNQQLERQFIISMGVSTEQVIFVKSVRERDGYKHYKSTVYSLSSEQNICMLLNLINLSPQELGYQDAQKQPPNTSCKTTSYNLLKQQTHTVTRHVWQLRRDDGNFVLKSGNVGREITILERLSEIGGVLKMVEMGEDWFMTKWAGDTLDALYKRNPDEMFYVVREASNIVTKVHSTSSMIHGDIKVSNIVFLESTVTIIDWGSADIIGSIRKGGITMSFAPLRYQKNTTNHGLKAMKRDDFEALFYCLLFLLCAATGKKYVLPFGPSQNFDEKVKKMKNVEELLKIIKNRREEREGYLQITKVQEDELRRMHKILFQNAEGNFSYDHEIPVLHTTETPKITVVSPQKPVKRRIIRRKLK